MAAGKEMVIVAHFPVLPMAASLKLNSIMSLELDIAGANYLWSIIQQLAIFND